MFAAANFSGASKAELYRTLEQQVQALTNGESDPIANMANCAALIFNSVPHLNWAGFYLLKEGELVLGPFQGQPACVRIVIGKGVCENANYSSRLRRHQIRWPHRLRQQFTIGNRRPDRERRFSIARCP